MYHTPTNTPKALETIDYFLTVFDLQNLFGGGTMWSWDRDGSYRNLVQLCTLVHSLFPVLFSNEPLGSDDCIRPISMRTKTVPCLLTMCRP